MKRLRAEGEENSVPKRLNFNPIMEEKDVNDLLTKMSKQVTDQITASLGGSISDLTKRMANVEQVTRFSVPQTPQVQASGSEVTIISDSTTKTNTKSSSTPARGRGKGRGGSRGRGSGSKTRGGSSGGRGGGVKKNRKGGEFVANMTRNDFEKMMSNHLLNYDSAKESAAREIILKGMPAEGNDVDTAAAHIKIIDPTFKSFEIEEVLRFAKPDPTGVPPLRVTFKRKAMATRINDLIELAGEEGVPWASASLPFLLRNRNRLVEKDVVDLNSKLPVNPPKHWATKKIGGHVKKKYVPNPNFNKEVVSAPLQLPEGATGVTAAQAKVAMENIAKITKAASAAEKSHNLEEAASIEESETEPMDDEDQEPDIENWTPAYREKIAKLLAMPEDVPPKAKTPPVLRSSRSRTNLKSSEKAE